MAKALGRSLLWKVKISGVYTVVGGLRTRTLTLNNAVVDVTTADSLFGGILNSEIEAGLQKLTVDGTILFDSDTTAKAVMDAARQQTALDSEIAVPNYGTFQNAGFIVTKLSFTGDHEKEMTASITLEASGAISFS